MNPIYIHLSGVPVGMTFELHVTHDDGTQTNIQTDLQSERLRSTQHAATSGAELAYSPLQRELGPLLRNPALAREAGAKHYLPMKPCVNGHESAYYTKGTKCIVCTTIRNNALRHPATTPKAWAALVRDLFMDHQYFGLHAHRDEIMRDLVGPDAPIPTIQGGYPNLDKFTKDTVAIEARRLADEYQARDVAAARVEAEVQKYVPQSAQATPVIPVPEADQHPTDLSAAVDPSLPRSLSEVPVPQSRAKIRPHTVGNERNEAEVAFDENASAEFDAMMQHFVGDYAAKPPTPLETAVAVPAPVAAPVPEPAPVAAPAPMAVPMIEVPADALPVPMVAAPVTPTSGVTPLPTTDPAPAPMFTVSAEPAPAPAPAPSDTTALDAILAETLGGTETV